MRSERDCWDEEGATDSKADEGGREEELLAVRVGGKRVLSCCTAGDCSRGVANVGLWGV